MAPSCSAVPGTGSSVVILNISVVTMLEYGSLLAACSGSSVVVLVPPPNFLCFFVFILGAVVHFLVAQEKNETFCGPFFVL